MITQSPELFQHQFAVLFEIQTFSLQCNSKLINSCSLYLGKGRGLQNDKLHHIEQCGPNWYSDTMISCSSV